MKKILIVAATEAEVDILLKSYTPLDIKDKYIKHFSTGSKEIDVLVTGVGMVATTFHLAKIDLSLYDLIINAGIAGSFNRNLLIGETTMVVSDGFAELGADYEESFVSIYEMGFAKKNKEAFFDEKGVIQNDFFPDTSELNQLKKVSAITVNTINVDESRIRKVMKYYAPDLESMEGAAVFYCCMKQNTPCLQIRSVSNYIEPRNLYSWNIPFAISNLNKKILEIFDTLK
jgi:futalosine hydrolase